MPNPQRLLNTLHRATAAFRATPGRRGRVVHLNGKSEVLVAGDLHGHVGNFQRLLEAARLADHPDRHLVVQELVHGPFRYPTGGDKSHQLLDLLAALKCQYPARVHMLLGNHEFAQWTNRRIAKHDLDLNDQFRAGLATAYAAHADEVYVAYLDLFKALPLAVRTGNRVFLSHSLPPASRLPAFDPAFLGRDSYAESDLAVNGPVHHLVWGRDTSATTAADFLGKVDADLLVTGHIHCQDGYQIANDRQLILDCQSSPAAFCLFPADGPLTLGELVACVGTL